MPAIGTATQAGATLTLRAENDLQGEETYKYAHLLPHFSQVNYPPLIPFEHVDPGFRAIKHSDPRAFLKGATSIIELTPNLGAEIRGIRLTDLDSNGRDQLALEVNTYSSVTRIAILISIVKQQVARRGVMVFRGQSDFIDQGPEAYLEWGRHFGRFVDSN